VHSMLSIGQAKRFDHGLSEAMYEIEGHLDVYMMCLLDQSLLMLCLSRIF